MHCNCSICPAGRRDAPRSGRIVPYGSSTPWMASTGAVMRGSRPGCRSHGIPGSARRRSIARRRHPHRRDSAPAAGAGRPIRTPPGPVRWTGWTASSTITCGAITMQASPGGGWHAARQCLRRRNGPPAPAGSRPARSSAAAPPRLRGACSRAAAARPAPRTSGRPGRTGRNPAANRPMPLRPVAGRTGLRPVTPHGDRAQALVQEHQRRCRGRRGACNALHFQATPLM
jgi:hypothetical protein